MGFRRAERCWQTEGRGRHGAMMETAPWFGEQALFVAFAHFLISPPTLGSCLLRGSQLTGRRAWTEAVQGRAWAEFRGGQCGRAGAASGPWRNWSWNWALKTGLHFEGKNSGGWREDPTDPLRPHYWEEQHKEAQGRPSQCSWDGSPVAVLMQRLARHRKLPPLPWGS